MKGKSPLRLLLPALALVLTLTAVLAGAASAEGSSVRLVGDKTKFVTDPATTKVLLDNGISPQPVGPTGFQLLQKDEGLSVRYSFPITGGSVNLSALTGAIDHSGGINFVNTNNGKSLLLTNFRIELGSATLTAGPTNSNMLTFTVVSTNVAPNPGVINGASPVNDFVQHLVPFLNRVGKPGNCGMRGG